MATPIAPSPSLGGCLTGPPEEGATLVAFIPKIGGPEVGPPLVEAMEVAPIILLTHTKRSMSKSPTKETPASNPLSILIKKNLYQLCPI